MRRIYWVDALKEVFTQYECKHPNLVINELDEYRHYDLKTCILRVPSKQRQNIDVTLHECKT